MRNPEPRVGPWATHVRVVSDCTCAMRSAKRCTCTKVSCEWGCSVYILGIFRTFAGKKIKSLILGKFGQTAFAHDSIGPALADRIWPENLQDGARPNLASCARLLQKGGRPEWWERGVLAALGLEGCWHKGVRPERWWGPKLCLCFLKFFSNNLVLVCIRVVPRFFAWRASPGGLQAACLEPPLSGRAPVRRLLSSLLPGFPCRPQPCFVFSFLCLEESVWGF